MEKVKDSTYQYLVINTFACIGAFVFLHVLLRFSLVVTSIIVSLSFITSFLFFFLANKSTEHGVFLSSEFIFFPDENIKIEWADLSVETVKVHSLTHYARINFKSIKNSTSTTADVFINNRKSFIKLVEKYAPSNHKLHLLLK
ncbi:MAG: hypothetical protein H7281_16110 [Bacteriovorax sp.]|nr:hypothetical protein [Bacteriovorax sp.]